MKRNKTVYIATVTADNWIWRVLKSHRVMRLSGMMWA